MNPSFESNPTTEQKLFSHLELDGDKLKPRSGSILGCTALIAGTTVGVGILALPTVTLPSGVIPSTVLLMAVWLYVLASSLLTAEVNLNAIHNSGRAGMGILGIIEYTFGSLAVPIIGIVYLFYHYAILVAYMAEGGEILLSAVQQISGIGFPLPKYLGAILFVTIFGGILYLGRSSLVEKINNAFVGILIASFVGLMILSATALNPVQFLHQNWSAVTPAISVMLVAFFYQNVVPVVVTELEGNVKKIRQCIIVGSVIPLIMFLIWNAVILGSISPNLLEEASNNGAVFDPLQVLRNGKMGVVLGVFVSVFSEFAIATSFIGFVYGLLDFFKDILNVDLNDDKKRFSLYSLALFPPMSLSAFNPGIFLTALDYAGTFSISILGGIIPAVIAWQQRDRSDFCPATNPLVPGGRVTLAVMIIIALAVIIEQILSVSGLEVR